MTDWKARALAGPLRECLILVRNQLTNEEYRGVSGAINEILALEGRCAVAEEAREEALSVCSISEKQRIEAEDAADAAEFQTQNLRDALEERITKARCEEASAKTTRAREGWCNRALALEGIRRILDPPSEDR